MSISGHELVWWSSIMAVLGGLIFGFFFLTEALNRRPFERTGISNCAPLPARQCVTFVKIGHKITHIWWLSSALYICTTASFLLACCLQINLMLMFRNSLYPYKSRSSLCASNLCEMKKSSKFNLQVEFPYLWCSFFIDSKNKLQIWKKA